MKLKKIFQKNGRYKIMLQQFRAILNYYKVFALWSFGVTILITIMYPEVIAAVITKLFLVILIWQLWKSKPVRKKLSLYSISGVSTFKLFSTLFLFDCVLTISFLLLVRGFI